MPPEDEDEDEEDFIRPPDEDEPIAPEEDEPIAPELVGDVLPPDDPCAAPWLAPAVPDPVALVPPVPAPAAALPPAVCASAALVPAATAAVASVDTRTLLNNMGFLQVCVQPEGYFDASQPACQTTP